MVIFNLTHSLRQFWIAGMRIWQILPNKRRSQIYYSINHNNNGPVYKFISGRLSMYSRHGHAGAFTWSETFSVDKEPFFSAQIEYQYITCITTVYAVSQTQLYGSLVVLRSYFAGHHHHEAPWRRRPTPFLCLVLCSIHEYECKVGFNCDYFERWYSGFFGTS